MTFLNYSPLMDESRDRPEAAAAGLQAGGPGEDLWGFSPLALDLAPVERTLLASGQEQSACPGCLTASAGRGAGPTSTAVPVRKGRQDAAAAADRPRRARALTGAGEARLDLSQGHFRTHRDREQMEALGQLRLDGF